MLRAIEASLRDAGLEVQLPLTAIQVGRSIKVFLLLFQGEAQRPFAVAKLARGPLGEGLLQHAHETLRALKLQLPLQVAGALPAPWLEGRLEGRWAAVEEFVEGASMTRRLWGKAGGDTSGDIKLALKWLLAFQASTQCGTKLDPAGFVQGQLAVMQRYYPGDGIAIDHGADLAREWRGCGPVVRRQGDYWAGNLLVTKGEALRVLDWEFSREQDWAFFDPLMFVCSYALALPGREREEEKFARALFLRDSSNLVGRLRGFLRDWLTAMGIEPKEIAAYFPLFLMQMATREHETYGENLEQDARWHALFLRYIEQADEFGRALVEWL